MFFFTGCGRTTRPGEFSAPDSQVDIYLAYESHELFNRLRIDIVDRVNNVATFKAADVFVILVRNIEKFERLKTRVQMARNLQDVLDDVADELTAIARDYRQLANIAIDSMKVALPWVDLLRPSAALGGTALE